MCTHVTHTQTHFSEPVATPQNQDAHPQPHSQFRSLSSLRPSSRAGKMDRRPSPSEKSGRDCWKVSPERKRSLSPLSPRRRVGTYSPLCRWCEVALQGWDRPRPAARFCDLWCWAAVAVFQSTQVADGTPPPSLVSTKPRCVPGHRPAAATPTFGGPSVSMWMSRQDSAARAELCHGGGSDATLDMIAVGSHPPPCMLTSVLGWGRHEETLAQACVPCLVPAGHPAPLPCHREAGPRRGSGGLVAAVSSLWGSVCLGYAAQHAGSPEVLRAFAGAVGPGSLCV